MTRLTRRILLAALLGLPSLGALAQQRTPVPNIPMNDAMGQFWSLKTTDDGSGNQEPVVAVVPMPTASGSSAIAPWPTTAPAASWTLKNGGGNLYGLDVTSGTVAGYVMLFDTASVPADGAVTPVKCWPLAASSSLTQRWNGGPPLLFRNGIQVVFSSTGCFTKTGSATAFVSGEIQ